MELTRTSHQVPAAAADEQRPAPFSHIGVLSGLPSTIPRSSDLKRLWAQHLGGFVSKLGEKYGSGRFHRSAGRWLLALVLLSVAQVVSAGAWSKLPDAVARLEKNPRDARADGTLRDAEDFLVGEALAGRLATVKALTDVYSDLVGPLIDGEARLARIQSRLAAVLAVVGEGQWNENRTKAMRTWTLAAHLYPVEGAIQRLARVMTPPMKPEPGQVWTAPPDWAELVFHPTLQYRMGCTVNDSACERNERFFRWVKVVDLWAGRTEVTNRSYRACVSVGRCSQPADPSFFAETDRDLEPVVGITFQQAKDHALWSARRLPSEAEWERIARGIDLIQRYPWGNRRRRALANFEGVDEIDSFRGLAPVSIFPATGHGVFDMIGNAGEWVEDRYHNNTSEAPSDGSPWLEGGIGRVVRGGSWRRTIEVARVSARAWREQDHYADDVGFRTVLDIGVSPVDIDLLFQAGEWFPVPSISGRELSVPGLDMVDRRYLRRRAVTWSVLEGRGLEALPHAVWLLRHDNDDPVALDLLDRVEASLRKSASAGRARETAAGVVLYGDNVTGVPFLKQRLDPVKESLARRLLDGGRRVMASEPVRGRRCFILASEFGANPAQVRRLLDRVRPGVGQSMAWAGDGRPMVWIPGTSYLLGAGAGDRDAKDNEHPARTVVIPGFWLDSNEVSNAEYSRCVLDGACSVPEVAPELFIDPGREGHPVVGITWYQARAYAVWAGKRLPVEAEWERAARQNSLARYPWGTIWQEGRVNSEGVDQVDRWGTTAPTGSFGRDEWGLSDMLGNVSEWMADIYHRDYRDAPRDARAWTQINGGPAEDRRAIRGGSHLSSPEELRVSARDVRAANEGARDLGFRCAADGNQR